MAAPLLSSVFKPTDFDKYLDEIGLGDMSPEARLKLVDALQETVQYRIVTEVLGGLETSQKLELARLMQEAEKTGDDTPANDWLMSQIPDIEGMVDDIIEQEKAKLKPGAAVFTKVLNEFLDFLEKREAALREEGVLDSVDDDATAAQTPLPEDHLDIVSPSTGTPVVPEAPAGAPSPAPTLPPLPDPEVWERAQKAADDAAKNEDHTDTSDAMSDELAAAKFPWES